MPSDVALEALAIVDTHLHVVAPEGAIPDDERLESLKEQLRNVLDEVKESRDVPDDVKDLLVHRLASVLEAIEHLKIGGPRAVRMATEALVGGIAMRNAGTFRSETGKRVVAVLGALWIAFSAGPTIQASIDAWGDLARKLGSGQETVRGGQASESAGSDATER